MQGDSTLNIEFLGKCPCQCSTTQLRGLCLGYQRFDRESMAGWQMSVKVPFEPLQVCRSIFVAGQADRIKLEASWLWSWTVFWDFRTWNQDFQYFSVAQYDDAPDIPLHSSRSCYWILRRMALKQLRMSRRRTGKKTGVVPCGEGPTYCGIQWG